MKKIKVLLATGTYEMSACLQEVLQSDPQFVVVAKAGNAYDARDRIIAERPDIMLLSNDLPRMEGIVFLRKLIPQYPLPTIMFATHDLKEKALKAGARGFFAIGSQEDCKCELQAGDLCKVAKDIVYQSWLEKCEEIEEEQPVTGKMPVIAIGASTGGTEAIAQVIRQLKENTPGIVMVQHMPEGFTQLYANRLNNECKVMVKEAKTGDVVKNGQVLLAPGDRHMRLVRINDMYQVECRSGPRVSGHCPSVDVLFSSVAHVAADNAIGVIMTGMGSDGAKGLKEMHDRGAKTIGQDEKTSVVYGMPKVAYDMGAVDYQLPLEQIAGKISQLADKKRKG